MQEKCCHCHKSKRRTEDEHKKLLNRLSRIEGQIRGIKGMVENDAYCVDIMMQVEAASSALDAFNRQMLSEHIKTCVTDDIKSGREEIPASCSNQFPRLLLSGMRSHALCEYEKQSQ